MSAIPEERLDRRKQSRVFPSLAIERCSRKNTGLTVRDIDEIAVAWNPAIEVQSTPPGYLDARRWRTEHLAQVPARLATLLGTPPNGEMTLDQPGPGRSSDHVRRSLSRSPGQRAHRVFGGSGRVPGDGRAWGDAHGGGWRPVRQRRAGAVRGPLSALARATGWSPSSWASSRTRTNGR